MIDYNSFEVNFMNKNLRNYGLKFDKSIKRWDEAIPLGNGKIGCLVYGDEPLKFAIDRIDLWENKSAEVWEKPEYNYKNLTKLVNDRNEESWNKLIETFEMGFRKKHYPTKITAGRLELNFNEKVKNVKSNLDVVKAVADFEVETESKNIKVVSFLSAVKFCGVIRVYGKFSKKFVIPYYISGNTELEKDEQASFTVQYDRILNYPPTTIIEDGEFTYFKQKTLTDYEYGVVILTKNYEEYTDIYYDIVTTDDNLDYIEYGKDRLISFANEGFDKLLLEHVKWWAKYWKKSDIDIPDKDLEKQYYLSWYLFASTSRKGFYPMPLQGVWTADINALPPWRGDYHHDTNTELSYMSYTKANRLEEGKVFVDFIWSIRGKIKKFTKKFFGVNGYLSPGTTSITGEVMSGWTQYSLSPTMTIWVAQCFDEYYLYSGDDKFLKNRAYPFFKGVAQAILGILKEKDGKLFLPLSTSPEVFDGSLNAYLEPNSNFDLALLKYLFTTLIKYCDILGFDSLVYKTALSKLEPYHVIEKDGEWRRGTLKVDKNNILPYSHRHLSHLMAIYPLHLLNYDIEDDRKIIDASINNLEGMGEGRYVGWSFTMAGAIFAMAKNGNASREKLVRYVKAFLSPNGFHLNGDYKNLGISILHYRPFTLEAHYSYCDTIQEMLMQDHKGYIDLFPAIPFEWEKKCSFSKFRSYGGVIVSANCINGVVEKVKLTSRKRQVVKIKNNFGVEKLRIIKNGKIIEMFCNIGDVFEIEVDSKPVEIIK